MYSVIELPPLLVGAFHVDEIVALETLAETDCGAPGTEFVVASAKSAEAEFPFEFVAMILKLYVVASVNPSITLLVAVSPAVVEMPVAVIV